MTLKHILKQLMAAATVLLAMTAFPAAAQYAAKKPDVTVYASPT